MEEKKIIGKERMAVPRVEVDEKSFEKAKEGVQEETSIAVTAERGVAPAAKTKSRQTITGVVVDAELKKIEGILSEGLGDIYKTLPDDIKPAFKTKGEEVAQTIRSWIDDAKIAAAKVLKLIREWLKMVPGINKYYLEQESKIRADKIIAFAASKEKKK
jgi:hypothetical protein